jgi:hypothetical protein
MSTLKSVQFFAFVSILLLASCKKDDSTNVLQTQVTTTIQAGTWKITFFNENGIDKTSNYSGFVYAFNAGGTATATRNSTTTNGSWASGTDDSKVKLILDFGVTSPLNELNEDWIVLERTDTKIRLTHISGGNGGTDFLTFEKN